MSSLNRLIPYVPLIIYLLFLAVSIAWLWRVLRPRDQHSLRTVAILVLGDIGRSPRMMYHAQSFAENGFVTDIIGYGGVYAVNIVFKADIAQDLNQFHRSSGCPASDFGFSQNYPSFSFVCLLSSLHLSKLCIR